MLALPKVARNDTVLRVNVGTLLLQQDRPAEALREFEAVRRQAPGAFRVDINIASALHALGRDREAMAALQRVRPRLQAEARRTGRPPVEELVYVHVLTGDILKARGDLDSARQEYLEAWKLRPGLPALKKKLSEIGKRTPTP
jgi:Flp pilus assembly protein TadD